MSKYVNEQHLSKEVLKLTIYSKGKTVQKITNEYISDTILQFKYLTLNTVN